MSGVRLQSVHRHFPGLDGVHGRGRRRLLDLLGVKTFPFLSLLVVRVPHPSKGLPPSGLELLRGPSPQIWKKRRKEVIKIGKKIYFRAKIK